LNLLLDTHVVIWWRINSPRLRASIRETIAGAPVVHVSVASAWEFAIKASLGRLRLEGRFEDGVAQSGFAKLPITFAHAERLATLPHHHRDPFDRMLVAQAQVEGLRLVTDDRRLELYEVEVLRP
jgi:PIN domain nuclease of toxin-antitoxin system